MTALMVFVFYGTGIAAEPGTGAETVVAKVDDEVITQRDIDKLLDSLDPQTSSMYRSPEGRAAITEELINAHLFALKGLEEGIDKSPEYLEEIERFKKHALMRVTIDKMLEKVEATNEDVKKFYDENPAQFAQPAQVHARHILVSDDVEMEKVLADIAAGETFENTAKKFSTCPSKENGGDLGFFERGQMVPEFENVAFETEVGKVSDPVKTQFGVHLIRVEAKNLDSKIPFENVEEQVKNYLSNQKRSEVYQEQLKQLKEKHVIERIAPDSE